MAEIIRIRMNSRLLLLLLCSETITWPFQEKEEAHISYLSAWKFEPKRGCLRGELGGREHKVTCSSRCAQKKNSFLYLFNSY